MRRRGIATFALGAVAGVTATAALTTGVLAEGAGGLVGAAQSLVRVPGAAAAELPAFDDCEQLRRWYVRAALPKVGPWGFSGPPVLYARDTLEAPRSMEKGTADAAGGSETGTNVQEADVDESDVAKTDGRIVVRVSGRALVLTDVSGSRPYEISRTTLPGPNLVSPELLLHGDRVLVVGDEQSVFHGPIPLVKDGTVGPTTDRGFLPEPSGDTRARLISFDISDPSSPRVTDSRTVDGGALSTREYADGTVRVVVSTGYPQLDFVRPNRDRTTSQATRENRRIVRDATVRDWLPTIRSSSGGEQTPACSDVRHPLRSSGLGTVSVLSFAFDDPDAYGIAAVTTSGELVYSSARRLYVATTSGRTSTVHAFALDGKSTSYVGSGALPGTVKDRWSLSEYDGHLRVATAVGDSWQPRDNAVVVLTERDGRLEITGRVDGLGRAEQIRAVRWFGDLAIVVTFRQTDPLYTIDLSDPAHPRVEGELKIPGYSTYLHPVGGDLLVGVGHDATTSGSELGAQAATFDLRNLGDVRRADTLSFGSGTGLGADTDPRTFSYLPAQRTLVTVVSDWQTSRSRFVALHVSRDGVLSPAGSWSTDSYVGSGVRALPLEHGRVALVDDQDVRVVQVG
jgi:hypothetical protein